MAINDDMSSFSAKLEELQHLLEKQLELAQQGDISKIAALSDQAATLVEEISRSGILELAEFAHQRRQLEKLYHSVCLAVMAQRADTGEKLSQIYRGKRAVRAYRKSI